MSLGMASSRVLSGRALTVFAVCAAIFALGQFHRASGSVFTPIMIDRFALSAAAAGGLVSAMFLANVVSQVPFGAALDRWGIRPVLLLSMLTIAFGTLVFAIADSYPGALVARVIIGLGMGAMGAASHVIIARSFPAADFGYVSGLVVTVGGIGGLSGTFPLAFALERLPWPQVFGAAAVAAVVLALLIRKVVTAEAAPDSGQGEDSGFRTLLKSRDFRLIVVMSAVTYAPIVTISGLWGGPYLQDVAGLSASAAGAVLMMFYAATLCAGTVFALLDRHARSRRRVILCAAGTSVASLWVLAALPEPPVALAVGLLVLMVVSQQFYIGLGAHMRQVVPLSMLGRASSLVVLVGVAGIPAMQTGFGAVLDLAAALGWSDADRYRLAFATMGCAIFLAAVVYSRAGGADPAGSRRD